MMPIAIFNNFFFSDSLIITLLTSKLYQTFLLFQKFLNQQFNNIKIHTKNANINNISPNKNEKKDNEKNIDYNIDNNNDKTIVKNNIIIELNDNGNDNEDFHTKWR